jgi:asparagine synthase (glutamine-hydrolysing)
MKAIAAVLDKRGENAPQTIVLMLKVLSHGHADAFAVATPKSFNVKNSLEGFTAEDFKSSVALGRVFVKVLAQDEPQPINVGATAMIFDGRVYHPPIESPADFLRQRLEAYGGSNTAENLIKEFDGSFAFAIAEDEKLIVGRDALGLYPLYYGENNSVFAIASERKALWKIGVKEAESFPPGHVLIADKRSFKTKPIKTPRSSVYQASVEEAVEKLQELLMQSHFERTADLGEVAVAFSGGLDSSLTALLAKKAGVNVHLIHVSLENQPETRQAEEAARLLGLPLHKYLYSEGDVENVLPKVLWCVESPDPLKTSIGIPFYWAAERASELGFKVMLAGQGADELFGGYRRYLTLYSRFGSESAERAMARDILSLYEDNFERDAKICSFHNVELRLPLASYPLVEFALSLPLNLKIGGEGETLRKLVLRKAAEKLGLPRQISYKPKKAIQYATGVDKVLKKLAERQNMPLKQYLQKVFQKVLQNCSEE